MSKNANALSIREKTLALNSAAEVYGTFAEIGAGQETSRWFFRTRGASSTVAKAISAYDMTFSDAIYGREETGRYVCESRLKKMLDHEYNLIHERLSSTRGSSTRFFSFANTVAARSQRTGDTGQGWIGIKFQKSPQSSAEEIRLHVRLFDKRNTLQQEALGDVGVNLIYSAFYHLDDPKKFIETLLEDIEEGRVEIDYIYASPGVFGISCQKLNFYLIESGATQTLTFSHDQRSLQPTDFLYKKNALLFRDSYKPTTNYHLDLMECAQSQMAKDQGCATAEIFRIAEIPFESLESHRTAEDFLGRLEMAQACGLNVVVTRYKKYYEFANFFEQNFAKSASILIKTQELSNILNESSYSHLKGGLLEGLGRYFSKGYRIYVSPSLQKGQIIDAQNYEIPSALQSLYAYFIGNNLIKGTQCLNQDHLKIRSEDIVSQIKQGQSDWVSLVPQPVADLIRSKKMFEN